MRSNQSRLQELEKCPRRYLWRYEMGLEPQRGSQKALFGTAGHAALAALYRGDSTYLLRFDQELGGLSQSSGSTPSPSTGQVQAVVQRDADYDKMREIWRERLQKYPEEYPQEAFEVVMVPEQEMMVSIGSHQLAVRVDLIVRKKVDGSLWVMDHKFASRTGSSYWPQYYVDKQGSAYLYAVGQQMGETPQGWIINAVKPVKERREWYERNAFTRDKWQMESFVRQTVRQLDRLEAARAKRPPEGEQEGWMDEEFPQFTHECHGFGTCAFLALCQAGKAALGLYKERERDYVDE